MKASDLLQAMLDAGAPIEAAMIALRAMEAKDAEIEHRRAGDRDRKRRQRAKDMDGTVTGQSRDMDGTVTDEPSLSPAPFPSPQTPQPNPHPHTHPETQTPARVRGDFPKPDWADPQVWADFLKNRKRKSMVNTATAYRGFLASIEKHATDEWPPGKLLEYATAKGWGSINEPDEMKGTANVRSVKRPQSASIIDIGRQVALDMERESAARFGN